MLLFHLYFLSLYFSFKIFFSPPFWCCDVFLHISFLEVSILLYFLVPVLILCCIVRLYFTCWLGFTGQKTCLCKQQAFQKIKRFPVMFFFFHAFRALTMSTFGIKTMVVLLKGVAFCNNMLVCVPFSCLEQLGLKVLEMK